MKNKFAYLLKRGTTWNHLKPPRNYMKPFETTWNQSYCSIFLLKINYSQVAFILILQPKVVFGQIWSPKLSFPNWPKFGAGVHYYILISNFLLFIFFWASLVPKSKVIQINWNLVWVYITMCLSRFWYSFFHNFCHSWFCWQIWSYNLDFFKLTEIS